MLTKIILENEMQFGDTFVGKKLIDVPEAQINMICLAPGQSVPPHNSNSNVRLLVLMGEISVILGEQTGTLSVHEMTAVDYDTPMRITNEGDSNTAFLVIKTPNPANYKQ